MSVDAFCSSVHRIYMSGKFPIQYIQSCLLFPDMYGCHNLVGETGKNSNNKICTEACNISYPILPEQFRMTCGNTFDDCQEILLEAHHLFSLRYIFKVPITYK